MAALLHKKDIQSCTGNFCSGGTWIMIHALILSTAMQLPCQYVAL